jgi:hypothetical protein
VCPAHAEPPAFTATVHESTRGTTSSSGVRTGGRP